MQLVKLNLWLRQTHIWPFTLNCYLINQQKYILLSKNQEDRFSHLDIFTSSSDRFKWNNFSNNLEEIAHANLILPNNANGTFYFRNVKIFKYTKTQFCFSLPIYGGTFLQWGHKGLRHWVLGWRNCPVSSTDLNCSAICRNERHRNYCFEPTDAGLLVPLVGVSITKGHNLKNCHSLLQWEESFAPKE